MLADEADAPGERFASAAGDPAVDQGVEHLTLLESKAGHGRRVDGGESHLALAAHHAPAHLSPESRLGVVGDGDTGFAGCLTEGDDLLLVSETGTWRPQVAGDEDLVGVVTNGEAVGEPPRREGVAEPVGENWGVERWGRRCGVATRSGISWRSHGNTDDRRWL